MICHSPVSRNPSKLPNLHLDSITPSKVPSSKPSILSVKYPLWLSIIIILLFHIPSSSTSTSFSEQAGLWSRVRLRARTVETGHIHTSQQDETANNCQTKTCKSTKRPLPTAGDSAKEITKPIHHRATISTKTKSSRSLRARDCTPHGTKKVSPVPPVPEKFKKTKESKKPKEKSTKPKTQNPFKPPPQKKEKPTEPKKPSQPETTKTQFSKEPFPNQKHDTDSSRSKPVNPKPVDAKPVNPKPVPLIRLKENDESTSKTLSGVTDSLRVNKSLSKKPQRPSDNHISTAPRHSKKPVSSSPDSADRWLAAHNDIRARYSVGNLIWSSKLEASAQAWANRCVFEHSQGKYGENIAAGQPTIESVVEDWVYGKDECEVYQPDSPVYSHFTQVIWEGTTQLGCAISNCHNLPGTPLKDAPYWVCQYNPPGNVLGEFDTNVHASAGQCLR
ncbi:uncharacterized protein PGTG_20576 [Puccinia graminis f. sp. tritici CRL 75-36-700-3]|uniref:SCP domain-containing protein n=1 Tax=Puccinia graminis f. sp. tritici (strain CRL 75-36-700-3 / race SCCL) TaxID=418459 RepID=H6QP02_PUCGT|nr:uncharacterized protein PGTG_20576 [Puccinia graminis f. sp. tritici CRL 75-36-700-3]EHS62451.1 hypothetical protein PGTG_20576 [Puccinia graminis f. sp. tritici CRL 75-36-700-3]